MARSATAQIGTALADGQIVVLDETRVESAGILGMKQCFLQFCLYAEQQSTIDLDQPILAALLDHLTAIAVGAAVR